MTSMIERVARAICVAHGDDPDHFDPVWQEFTWVLYEPHAQAALSAMKDPTDEMHEAGYNITEEDMTVEIWKAMIEAAEAGK